MTIAANTSPQNPNAEPVSDEILALREMSFACKQISRHINGGLTLADEGLSAMLLQFSRALVYLLEEWQKQNASDTAPELASTQSSTGAVRPPTDDLHEALRLGEFSCSCLVIARHIDEGLTLTDDALVRALKDFAGEIASLLELGRERHARAS